MTQLTRVTTLSPATIGNFRSSLIAKGRSDQTVKAYTTDLFLLLEATDGSIPMEDFQTTGMYWLTTFKTTLAAKTTIRRMTSLKAFARWAKWPTDELEDYSLPTPLRGQPHPIPEGMDGVRRMIRAAENDRYKCLIAGGGFLGLRVAETLNLRPSSFDLKRMCVVVRGKGDKDREVPISTECWEVVESEVYRAFATGDDRLIVDLKDRFARSTITRLGEKAKLMRRVSSHDLRATFATELYNRTQDQRLVQLLLGHASMDQTSLYIGITESTLHQGVNAL